MKLLAQQQAVVEQRQQNERRRLARDKFSMDKYKKKYYQNTEMENVIGEESKTICEEEFEVLSAEQMEEMMRVAGVNYNNQKQQVLWLPLHYYDDDNFNIKSDDHWLTYPNLKLIALQKIQSKYQWAEATLISYNKLTSKFIVLYQNTQTQLDLPKLYCYFHLEKVERFIQRNKLAMQKRIYADSIIRYKCFIQNMPQQQGCELEIQQIRKLEKQAMGKRLEGSDTSELIIEINKDYQNAMNQIIFDKCLKEFNSELLPHHLELPQNIINKPLYFGQLELEAKKGIKELSMWNYKEVYKKEAMTFTEIFKIFCLESIHLKKEIVLSLQEIKHQSNKVTIFKLFELTINQSLRLEEFKQLQENQANNGLMNLKEWVQNVVNIVKNRLGEIKKGWFCLKDLDKENYQNGKLKRFLILIRQIMQDSLRDCVKENFKNFVQMIIEYLPQEIIIENCFKVQNLWGDKKSKQGLFLIELQLNGLNFKYSFQPQSLVQQIMLFFDKLLDELQRIPDIESKVIGDFIQGIKQDKFLKSPTRPAQRNNENIYVENYEWLFELHQQLNQQLLRGVEPLQKFIECFDIFKTILELDHESYIKHYDIKEKSEEGDEQQQIDINEINLEIKRLNVLELQLSAEIKDNIQVGFFQVNCKEVYEFIIKKYQKLQKNLKEIIAKRAKLETKQILDQFFVIQNKISKKINDIEGLTEVREFILNEIPTELENLQLSMDETMKIFEILDDLNFKMEIDDLNKKYKILGSVRETNGLIEQREQYLEKDKQKFLEQMKVSQQEFKENMDSLDKTIKSFSQYTNIEKHGEVSKQVKQIQETLNQYIEEARKFNSRENLFDMSTTDYGKLQNMSKEFAPYSNLWLTSTQWFHNIDEWMNSDWWGLDAVFAEKFVDEGLRTLAGVIKYFKEKQLSKNLQIAEKVREEIMQFRPKVPLMVALRKQGMTDRHWTQVSELMGLEINPKEDPGFNFNKALQLGLMEQVEKIVEIGETASKEYGIETMLRNMQKIWEDINFDLKQYKHTYIIKNYNDMGNTLDEHILNTQQMMFSPYRKPFEQEIILWNDNLKLMSEVTEEWCKVQLQWMYLQPIFESPDIAKQLPGETKKFKIVDSIWKQSLQIAKQLQNVLKTCQTEGLLDKMRQSTESLNVIQKALDDYLEKKREGFPRFYFLANNDLIAILSETKEPTTVQPHLNKVFENMCEVEFDESKKILAMYSAEREKVDFVRPVNPVGKSVEHWMTDLEDMMKISVRHELEKSILSYKTTPRKEWVLKQKGQCVLNGSQVHWTSEVEDSLRQGGKAVKDYYDKSIDQLNDLVDLVRTKLSKELIISLNALIVIDVHARYVVDSLVINNIQDVGAFEWISFLRYYWQDEDCYVKCVQTSFPYGYEYLGNTPRLVITPLTDQCYMTLMGALKLNLGGAPAGPAGTGKTESTKDLAKALAKQCVVFNCSDQMDYLMVARMFKGLASSGAWCCFDEFNRINIEVLSVIAQQLQLLFGCKANGISQVTFEGSEIKVLPTFSVFITMNPGYAGRTELPDNLKALFRPMAMMVPNYELIAEIRLYSFGFRMGSLLAKKMVTTFSLASECLSSQYHYDYGMRAVSSVIGAAGLLKGQYPDMDEQQLLLRALRDVNVPKFLKQDLPLFENIILDLFPGVEKPKYDYGTLEVAIKEVCQEMNLQLTSVFQAKIYQLYDTILIRHGLMLVGPSGGGKTKTYQVLSKALSKCENTGFYQVENHVLNPKAIQMGQLYGEFNLQTKEWTDGILANMIREEVKDLSGKRHWTVFDGPVDAIWIESMNTVLDDNKKLCLNSGQIITLSSYMTMIFEVMDLSQASPATVSRCGMVYMEPQALTYFPYLNSWFNTLPKELMDKISFNKSIKSLFDLYLPMTLEFNRKNSKEIVETNDNDIVASLCKLLDCYLNPESLKKAEKPLTTEQVDNIENILDPLFFFSLIWSIGVTGDDSSRIKFNAFFKEKLNTQSKIPFPKDQTIYDYMFDENEKQFSLWQDQIKGFTIDPTSAYNEILVQTSDSTRNLYLSKLLILNNKNMLISGPTGTGKTQNAILLLSKQLGTEYQYIYMAFSAQTSENQTQDTIDSKLERRRRGHYGPGSGLKKLIVFVDDLNMPKKEKYLAQPPIEILRQFLDHRGWYDRKTLSFMVLEDLIMFCAMGTPGGGRTFITPRMTRHFNIIGYTELDQQIIKHIFNTLSSSFLKRLNDDIKELIPKMVDSLLIVYEEVKKVFLPTPAKCHYLFNLRDISKVVQGICWASIKHTTEPIHLVRLWYHEIMRVFHDRLTTEKDREDIKLMVTSVAQEQMNFQPAEINNLEKTIFIDFMNGRDQENKPYYQVLDIQEMLTKIVDYQDEYNTEMAYSAGKSSLNLVLFLDACEHICRITRILRQPQGNALLLGVGGSGRQSLSKLASFIANYKVIQIELVKNYSIRSWREDLKIVLMTAGVENKSTTFLLVDTQIIVEQQVEDINSILNSGDVANLYPQKELDDIYNACKQECVKKGLAPNKMNFYATYLARVKRNFHLIFCMSPIGDAFATRVKMFPSLVNNCTLDLFTEWPEEALIGVGKGQIADNEKDLGIEDQRDQLVEMFKNIHKSVEKKRIDFYNQYNRMVYVTPKSYLEQLSAYQSILKEKKDHNNSATIRLQDGLDKLMFAEKEVSNMENILTEKQPKLAVAKVEIAILIEKLEVDKKEANEKQAIVAVEEAAANIQAKEANEIKLYAEQSVSEAQRKLDQTTEDVKLLQTNHISEIKSFQVPAPAVKLVMGGICYFLIDEIKEKGGEIVKILDPEDQFKRKKIEDYYATSKLYLLNNPEKLKQKLLNYPKESITPQIIKNYEEKIKSNPDYNFEKALSANKAVSFLFKWCEAMYDFDKTFKETAPLRAKLENAQRIVAEKTAELKIKKDMLDQINNKIQQLEDLYQSKNNEQVELTNDIEDCSLKLSRAQRLVQCLGDEKLRWGIEVKNFRAQSKLLAGDSVIAAGMISYSGPFTSDFRVIMEKEWVEQLKVLNIPHSDNCRMIEFMGDPVLKQYWTINCGLPKDDTSSENGIMIEKSKRWTLMIDPQTQANKFIKNMGRDNKEGFEVVKASDLTLMRTLEKAIQFGQWVLVENVAKDLDPALEPILQKQLKKEGSNYFINIGDKQIPYDTKFKFFMTTTIPNPHFSPENFAKVTIINFSITPNGLEEQMLAQVVALENSQMEIKKQEIVKKNAEDRKQLLDIENGILKSLGEVKEIADVLKDENLIIQLQDSKKFATEINQRVEDSKITEKQIDEARESYRPVATRASLLFFCIIDLGEIDPMYQYSLQWFQNLFTMGVQNSPLSNVLETRLNNLNEYFTYSLYENVCRSLFEKHKLLFSFLLTVRMEFFKTNLDPQEWRYFLTGPTGEIIIKPNPVDWIDQNSWPDIYRQIYGANSFFEGFDEYFYNNIQLFKPIYDSNEPQNEKLPGGWEDKLNEFQKMIILKAIRSDKLVPGVQNYISNKIGRQFILNPTFDLSKCFKDSSIYTPLIFVLSSGSDPVADYMKFWDEMNMSAKYEKKIISLGQGQGIHAENRIKEACAKGGWVLLQNCHLSIKWLTDLEKIIEDFSDHVHKDFRLWLTSSPEPKFPISILQNGIKMTLEPPKGLRNNLLRTYANIDDKQLEDCSKPREFKKLLFGFCLFHAIIQDRRKFGPIGWNIQYDFTMEDLMCCRRQLQSLLNDYVDIPYKVINILGARVNYGGRVTDKKDIVLITTILENFISAEALEDDYKFSESGLYYSVNAESQQEYINYIESFPLNPSPEAFGLHENAEISNSQSETRDLIATMTSISGKTTNKSGKSREELIEDIAIFVQKKTPPIIDEEFVMNKFPTDYNQSLNTIVLQEVIKYNRLLRQMVSSLDQVRLALNGRIGMSDELSLMANSLFDNQVPLMWSTVGFLSLKPLGSWTQDLIDRVTFFNSWVYQGAPQAFWFSGFFFPQAFITGVLQNFARKYVIEIDKIDFNYDIKDMIKPQDVKSAPENGCLVYGMFLEGCRWDYERHQLTQSKAKELFSDLPMIHLVPIKGRLPNTNATEGIYLCPLYKVESRKGELLTTGHSTNFVRDLELPTDLSQKVWIKAGVASFLSLRY